MIGKILKYMRKSKNKSQEEIAKIISIKQNTLSDYENMKISIDFNTIEKIASICNYEIIFIEKDTKEIINSKNIERKEL